MGERKVRGARRGNSSAWPWGALANAGQDRHRADADGVKDFFLARFSSTQRIRAQSLSGAPRSTRPRSLAGKIDLPQFHLGSAATRHRAIRGRDK